MQTKLNRMTGPKVTTGWRRLVLSLMLLCLFATTSMLVIPRTQAGGQLPLPVTILQFGAFPGDGQDDTDAMQEAADYLSAHPGTTLIYPPGVYNITRTVDYAHEFDGMVRSKAVVYTNCHNVAILGVGAIIDVKGDFDKRISIQNPDPIRNADGSIFTAHGLPVHYAETFALNPFWFTDSSDFTLSGFEIRGNVDRTTQNNQSVYLGEGYSMAVVTSQCHDLVLENLSIHHMLTDGITLGNDRNVTIRHVVSANNDRNAISTGPSKDLLVTDSEFRDSGVVGTASNSYPVHSPSAGVDTEPESYPDADWVPCAPPPGACYRRPGFHLAGNILFDRVRVTGNLGTQMAFASGQSSANVTVRNSTIKNPPGGGQFLLAMGIAGGVVEDSCLDAQKGFIQMITDNAFCTGCSLPQHDSPDYHNFLLEMAADPFLAAHGIIGETRSISTTLRRNTIHGQDTLLYDPTPLPFLDITDNEFRGEQTADLDRYYNTGYVYVAYGNPPPGRTWTPVTNIERNRFFIPRTLPRSNSGYGDILYQGVSHFEGNEYIMTGTRELPFFRVAYDQIGTVVNDRFPTNGSIIPVRFLDGHQYTLLQGGYFNFPQ